MRDKPSRGQGGPKISCPRKLTSSETRIASVDVLGAASGSVVGGRVGSFVVTAADGEHGMKNYGGCVTLTLRGWLFLWLARGVGNPFWKSWGRLNEGERHYPPG